MFFRKGKTKAIKSTCYARVCQLKMRLGRNALIRVSVTVKKPNFEETKVTILYRFVQWIFGKAQTHYFLLVKVYVIFSFSKAPEKT